MCVCVCVAFVLGSGQPTKTLGTPFIQSNLHVSNSKLYWLEYVLVRYCIQIQLDLDMKENSIEHEFLDFFAHVFCIPTIPHMHRLY